MDFQKIITTTAFSWSFLVLVYFFPIAVDIIVQAFFSDNAPLSVLGGSSGHILLSREIWDKPLVTRQEVNTDTDSRWCLFAQRSPAEQVMATW